MRTLEFAKAIGVALVLSGSSAAFARASDATSAPAPTESAASLANHQLVEKVRAALTLSKPTLPMQTIVVLAHNGVITLQGSIENAGQGAQAEKVARGVSGVTSVTNKLSPPERGE